MNEAKRDARVATIEERLKADRDAIPEGPGIVLDEREAIAVGLALEALARDHGEDLMGIFMKTSGQTVIDGEEIVDLERVFAATLARYRRAKSADQH